MSHEVLCPNGHKLRVEVSHIGKKAKCAKCGAVFVVPELSAEPPGLKAAEEPLELSDQIPPPVPAQERPPMVGDRLRSSASRRASGSGALGISGGLGQTMMLVGLILVLLSRGWDSVGNRGVQRAQGKLQMAQRRLDYKYEDLESDYTEERETIEKKRDKGKEALTADEEKRLDELRKKVTELDDKKRDEVRKLSRGSWRALRRTAQDAGLKNWMMGYWREILFVLGTLVLAVGLVAYGSVAEGAARWICMIMLAIIVLSIYVGGQAWKASTEGPTRMGIEGPARVRGDF
jgi:hypothetical protein